MEMRDGAGLARAMQEGGTPLHSGPQQHADPLGAAAAVIRPGRTEELGAGSRERCPIT